MSSFQVKIVGDYCNLRCSYCRNRDFDLRSSTVMSVDVLGRIIELVNTLPQVPIQMHWHGGEPLLAGKNFFANVMRIESGYPQKQWRNCVQTNATLVDHEWARFFKENSFNVGVSVDGCERTHNTNRVNVSGNNTYAQVMRGVEVLRHYGLRPGVICTVTKKTVKDGAEMLRSLVDAGFEELSFNAFYNTASTNFEDIYGLSDQEWFDFLVDIFEEWLSINSPSVRIREVDGILAWTKGVSANNCSFRGACNQWFAIHYTGEIYPCERTGKTIALGHVRDFVAFEQLLQSPAYMIWKEKLMQMPEKCSTCALLPVCYNGCVAHRESRSQEPPVYVYCESRQRFYNYIKQRLNEEVEV